MGHANYGPPGARFATPYLKPEGGHLLTLSMEEGIEIVPLAAQGLPPVEVRDEAIWMP